jgi:cell division protein FtsN
VRVGAYPTAEAADRGRVELAARGLDGLVVRVQPDDGAIDP